MFEKFEAEMQQIFQVAEFPDKIMVAVSGGSDSMALCLLVKTWCLHNNVGLCAITIDHALRSESADEAELVHEWLSRHDIEHVTIRREGPSPKAGIQQFARNARYQLMIQTCKEIGASAVLVGHQLEDQLETFLMRVSKGSALQGLSVMRARVKRNNIDIIRPLLRFHRSDLRTYLKELGQDWIEDPSNENPEYTRTELGRVLQSMKNLPGSSLSSMSLAVMRLQRADDALSFLTRKMLLEKSHVDPLGFVQIPMDFHVGNPAEINIRFLSDCFKIVRGGGKLMKLTHMEHLLTRISTLKDKKPITLAGCQMRPYKESWIICREPGREGLPETVLGGANQVYWDHRFLVLDHGNLHDREQTSGYKIRRLGEAGWRQITESSIPNHIAKLPSMVRKNLPALWNGDEIVSVPLFSGENTVMGIAKGRFEMVFIPKINPK